MSERKTFALLIVAAEGQDGQLEWMVLQRKDGGHPRETHRDRFTVWGGSHGTSTDFREILTVRLAQQFTGDLPKLLLDRLQEKIWDSGDTEDAGVPTRHLVGIAVLSAEEFKWQRAHLNAATEGHSVVLRTTDVRALLSDPDCWLPGVPELLRSAHPDLFGSEEVHA